MENPEEIVKEVVKTDEKRQIPGRFQKGNRANPYGRPRKPEIELLRQALDKAKQEMGMDFIEHFVRMAYKHKEVAIALAKKLLPDKLEGEGFGTDITAVFG